MSRQPTASVVKQTLCIYCGQHPGTTRDHIPPRCFFEVPCPNINRITVPCCPACKIADEPSDAKARNLFISTLQAEPHPAVERQLAGARNRALKVHGQLPNLLAHLVEADVHSPDGIYLGSAPAFNLDSQVVDSFLHRVVRGLLYSISKSGYLPSKIKWRTNVPPDVLATFPSTISRSVGDVFSYRVVFAEGSQASLWL